MDCQWHQDNQTAFICMKCGREFCRACLVETNNMHYCPDCNREQVERLASQMRARTEKPVAGRGGQKRRKGERTTVFPAGVPRAAPGPESSAPPAPGPVVDREETWIVPEVPAVLSPTQAAGSAACAAPDISPEPGPAPEAGPEPGEARGSRRTKPKKLRAPRARRSTLAAPEQSVTEPAESLLSPEERAAFWGESKAGGVTRAEPLPAAGEPAGDEYAPRMAGAASRGRRRKRGGVSSPVAMQTPDEYGGELTASPAYLKAVLFGLLAGLLLAAGYAGFEWWKHSGRWIFGWVLGFGVGLVVVLASGRHFNWKLGLVSAAIAWASLALGQLAFAMLDVRYNSILPIKLPFMTLLEQASRELLKAFASPWAVMFAITGLVAFLMSFRPWPVRLQLSGRPEAGGLARR